EPTAALPRSFYDDIRRPHSSDTDRSAVEFERTAAMRRAGFTESEAWTVVSDPLHAGFTRSRNRGRTWWRRYAWNDVAVGEVKPRVRRRGPARTVWDGPYEWERVVLPAARALRTLWHRWGTRRRHTIDQVLAVAADRYTRYGLDPQPLSLRGLVEDTGL